MKAEDVQPAPEVILNAVQRETEALLDDLHGEFLDIDLQGQLVLDGLTGGHVVTHLSREGDRMADEVLAALGLPVPPPDSGRQWEVRYGADRPGAVLLDDAIESSKRFQDATELVGNWTGFPEAIRHIPGRRLVQLLVHHADLGRAWDSVPVEHASMALALLPFVVPEEFAAIQFAERPHEPLRHESTEGGTTISGDARQILAWASGRTAVDGLPNVPTRTWF